MQTLKLEDRTLTELDHVRITKLMLRQRCDPEAGAALETVLDEAELVPSRQVSSDVVTMYSQVLLRDLATGEQRTVTLCYPDDAEPAKGFVSVLSPIGIALLGARIGSVVEWMPPGGRQVAVEVLALLFQPEASGDYTL